MPQLSIEFDGVTYDPAQDKVRLSSQLEIVRQAMLDLREHTLSELARLAHASTASVSARLRDLRKARHGGYQIVRRRKSGGVYAYHMMPWSEE